MVSFIVGICFVVGLGIFVISLKYWCDKDVENYRKRLQEEGSFSKEDVEKKEFKLNIKQCTNKDGKKYAVLLPDEK